MNITIEPLSYAHLPSVMKIERESYTMPWSEASFKSELCNPYGLSFAALMDGAVVGYVCASWQMDEGHILNLTVHPAHRRSGTGRSLLKHVLQKMKENGCLYVYLEVRDSNIAARKLYESAGFREVGRRKLYYIQPFEDAVLMALAL